MATQFKKPKLGLMRELLNQPQPTPAGPTPSPAPTAPPPDPRLEAVMRLRQQADALEAQLAPPAPRGGVGNMLLRSLGEGVMATTHPQGYFGYQQDQAVAERQRQQDLLARAKGLRGEATEQEQLGLQERNIGIQGQRLDIDRQQADFQRQNIASQIRERERQARMPMEVTGGASLMVPETGEIRGTAPLLRTPTEKNPGYRDVTENGRTIRKYFDQSDPGTVTYQEDIGAAQMPSQPGYFTFMTNPAGQVVAKANSETGEITPVENPQGVRRSSLPVEAQNRLASFDATDNIIADIKKYSDKIHTSEGATARAGGLLRRVKGYAGYDNDVTLLRSKAGELSQIIRAMGEVGALAEGDVARGVALVPIQPELTKTEATSMIADLQALVQKGRDAYKRQWGLGSAAETPPSGGAATATPGDPLGLFGGR